MAIWVALALFPGANNSIEEKTIVATKSKSNTVDGFLKINKLYKTKNDIIIKNSTTEISLHPKIAANNTIDKKIKNLFLF
jgi:hypothetical protein